MQTSNIPMPVFEQMGPTMPIPQDGLPHLPQVLGTKSALLSEEEMVRQSMMQQSADTNNLAPAFATKQLGSLDRSTSSNQYDPAAALGLDVAPLPSNSQQPSEVQQLKASAEFGDKAFEGVPTKAVTLYTKALPPSSSLDQQEEGTEGETTSHLGMLQQSSAVLVGGGDDADDDEETSIESLSIGMVVLFSLVGVLIISILSFATFKTVKLVTKAWEVKKGAVVQGGRQGDGQGFSRWEVSSDAGGSDVDSLLDGNASAIYSDFDV